MNTEKTELFVIVKENRGYPYSHIEVDVREATVSDLNDAIKMNDIPFMFNSDYDGLTIKNQYGSTYSDSIDGDERPNKAYGYEISYELPEVRLSDAERIVKVLRSVNRKIDNLSRKNGSSKDYMEYISRVLGILKVKNAYIVTQKGNKRWAEGKKAVQNEIARLDKMMEYGQ